MSTSDQKLCTKFWLSPLSFCLWLDGINSRFVSHLYNKSKEKFYNQRARESKCRRTKTVHKDILITYRFSDRKFSQSIITTSGLPQKQEIRNNSPSSLFHKLLTNVTRMKSLSKTVSWNEIHKSLLRHSWPYHLIIFVNIIRVCILNQKLESSADNIASIKFFVIVGSTETDHDCRDKITYC